MMRQYELVERVMRYNPNANEALLNKAYVYAMRVHGSQLRASGDPYFSHPLEVAAILTDLKLDDASIVVGLLHDTIEDTDATRSEIDDLFGVEIGKLVEGLTKLNKLDLVSKKSVQAENLRKLLLAISDDVRVLLVKLADRLHNMRTIEHMPVQKRIRIAEETMDIYAPLAGRMGMHGMREELENIAFCNINNEAYTTITNKLTKLREKNGELIENIKTMLSEKLSDGGIRSNVMGREKRAYSIFRKMQHKSIAFEQLSDIFAFRVIVDDTAICYQALGIVHTTWRTVPGRFKDYISTPKQNDYRSIHTTIVGPDSQRVELQIRSRDMHHIAEYGIAAHSFYKDFGNEQNNNSHLRKLSEDSQAYAWLRRTIELLAAGDNAEEFLEHTKLELFQDQVFCFTPKGRLIALPRGATPVDFAYAVHTNIGDTTVGCKINGQIAPLVTVLQNGDEVEIIRSDAQVPPAAWQSIAVTGKARSAIRRAAKSASQKQYAGLGKQILTRAFERIGQSLDLAALKAILPHLSCVSIEELFASVGKAEISSNTILKAVSPEYQEERVKHSNGKRNDEGWFGLSRAVGMKFRVPGWRHRNARGNHASQAISIRGLSGDLPVHFAPDSGAVPGDRIIGILSPGKGITVYPIQSPALQEFEDQLDKWLDIKWEIDENNNDRFPALIRVSALNEPGTLAQITEVISKTGGNIDNIRMVRRARDFHDMMIKIEVWDLKHLNRIISQLRAKSAISHVERVNG